MHYPQESRLALHPGVRPMRVEDLGAVMEIEPSIYPFPWSLGNFLDSLQAGYPGYVLEVENRIVAYALLMPCLDEVHLLNLSVALHSQRQGYGRYLLIHLLQAARDMQSKRMLLEVRPSNTAALALYRYCGFNEIGRRKAYYPAAGQTREDAMVMECVL